ncbi:hypothetical protein EON83_04790 [bacterium]|nr:MAG: hypothetical protein EON83_04790 [bacterium]
MTDSAPERATPHTSEHAPTHSVSGLGTSAGVRLRRKRSFADWIAFLLSAILSPYLVIPVGTVGIIYARTSHSPRQFLAWVSISLLFSTALPLLYILVGMWRGTISDVHVMERDQRGGPFVVAIVGGFLGAFLLYLMQAPVSVWGLSIIQGVNGLAILAITNFTKISVHVSVLSATVMGAIALNPQFSPYWVIWLVPVLMWARTKRGRHSWGQGIAGFAVASSVTSLVLAGLGLSDRLTWLWQRF